MPVAALEAADAKAPKNQAREPRGGSANAKWHTMKARAMLSGPQAYAKFCAQSLRKPLNVKQADKLAQTMQNDFADL